MKDPRKNMKKIRYDEEKQAEYIRYRGKKVYGSWNEMNPTRDNKVNASKIVINKGKDGRWMVDEREWDKRNNP